MKHCFAEMDYGWIDVFQEQAQLCLFLQCVLQDQAQLVVRFLSLSSDFIMGVYCVSQSGSHDSQRGEQLENLEIPQLLLRMDNIYIEILLAFSWCSLFRDRTHTFGCRSPRVTSTPPTPPYTTVIILSLHFWGAADSTSFVSCSSTLSFHSTEINVTHCINILTITITLFSKLGKKYIFPFILRGKCSTLVLLLLQHTFSYQNI